MTGFERRGKKGVPPVPMDRAPSATLPIILDAISLRASPQLPSLAGTAYLAPGHCTSGLQCVGWRTLSTPCPYACSRTERECRRVYSRRDTSLSTIHYRSKF